MLISHLVINHKDPGPRFAPGLFIALLAVFTLLGEAKPVVGLTGLGVTLVTAGSLIIMNRQRIWAQYKKSFRKAKGIRGFWTKPDPIYYTLNVVFLWPFIIFLGIVCLFAAYVLG